VHRGRILWVAGTQPPQENPDLAPGAQTFSLEEQGGQQGSPTPGIMFPVIHFIIIIIIVD